MVGGRPLVAIPIWRRSFARGASGCGRCASMQAPKLADSGLVRRLAGCPIVEPGVTAAMTPLTAHRSARARRFSDRTSRARRSASACARDRPRPRRRSVRAVGVVHGVGVALTVAADLGFGVLLTRDGARAERTGRTPGCRRAAARLARGRSAQRAPVRGRRLDRQPTPDRLRACASPRCSASSARHMDASARSSSRSRDGCRSCSASRRPGLPCRSPASWWLMRAVGRWGRWWRSGWVDGAGGAVVALDGACDRRAVRADCDGARVVAHGIRDRSPTISATRAAGVAAAARAAVRRRRHRREPRPARRAADARRALDVVRRRPVSRRRRASAASPTLAPQAVFGGALPVLSHEFERDRQATSRVFHKLDLALLGFGALTAAACIALGAAAASPRLWPDVRRRRAGADVDWRRPDPGAQQLRPQNCALRRRRRIGGRALERGCARRAGGRSSDVDSDAWQHRRRRRRLHRRGRDLAAAAARGSRIRTSVSAFRRTITVRLKPDTTHEGV